jgi:hypothetical protein
MKNIDLGPICADWDEDCIDIKCPTKCWIGDEGTGPTVGYCPMMCNGDKHEYYMA